MLSVILRPNEQKTEDGLDPHERTRMREARGMRCRICSHLLSTTLVPRVHFYEAINTR